MSVYCLTDIHISPTNHNPFLQDWGNEIIINSFSSESRGVSILLGDNLEYKILEVEKDDVGNLLMAKICFYQEYTILLVVLYGPNRDDPGFYDNLKERIIDKENLPLIICGDWNLVQNFEIDTFGYQRENNTKAKAKVQVMQTALDLEDVWRINNEKFKRYTWFSSKSPRQMARLDFFLTTPDIHSKLKNTSISHGYRTDHSALTLELNLFEAKHGKGFWKFNTSLLHDKEYINVVKQEICNTISQYKCNEKSNVGGREFTIDNQLFFEMLKLNIRGQSVAYSSRKAKYNRDKETKIEQNITNLENELTEACLSNSQDKIFELEKLDHEKLDLRDIREAKLKASVRRSKVQYYEEGRRQQIFFVTWRSAITLIRS